MESRPKIEALEKEIERLSKEVQDYRTRTGAEKSEEAAVREVLKERIYPAPVPAPAPTPPPVKEAADTSRILPAYLQKESPEIKAKIEELISAAFQEGIDRSIEEAREFGPFVLDALHDALTVKLYRELKNRKLI